MKKVLPIDYIGIYDPERMAIPESKYALRDRVGLTQVGDTLGVVKLLKVFGRRGLGFITGVFECGFRDCGNLFVAPVCHIRNSVVNKGQVRSCGCRRKAKGIKKRSKYDLHPEFMGSGIPVYLWANILMNAKYRDIEVSISSAQAWEIFNSQSGKCALTGRTIRFADRCDDAVCTASLDRIDSSKGYTLDNVQWVHKYINIMKGALDERIFIMLCKEVADYDRKKS